jgi:thioredoxin 1
MNIPDNCLLKFEASWCMPCQVLKPVLEKVKESTGVEVVSIDIDDAPELATRYGVRGVPTVFAIKDAAPVKMLVGAKKESDYIEMAELVK